MADEEAGQEFLFLQFGGPEDLPLKSIWRRVRPILKLSLDNAAVDVRNWTVSDDPGHRTVSPERPDDRSP